MTYLARTLTAFVFLFLMSDHASAQSRCRAADTDSNHFFARNQPHDGIGLGRLPHIFQPPSSYTNADNASK